MPDRSFEELADLLALCTIKGVGAARLAALMEKFGSASEILRADIADLEIVDGIPSGVAAAIAASERGDAVFKQCEKVLRTDTTVIASTDSDYPPHLAEIEDPPQLLFVQGNTGLISLPGVAIVGTRRPSDYGKLVTRQLVTELVRHGVTIVSGMARGVDSIAHSVALKSGGLTIAVLGCGVDVVYPPESRNLHERIREQGALVSELWLGSPPDRINFPRRNRIISGLCRAVVVTEAPLNSGARITADIALKQGRDIYAVPGDITRNEAAGVNALIAEGARVVTDTGDLLVNLGLGTRVETSDGMQMGLPIAAPADLSEDERTVLDALTLEPVHVDTLASKLQRTTSDVLTSLTLMEMRGIVVAHAGACFSRATTLG